MDEESINNRLSLIGTYAFTKGFRPKTYFGQLSLQNGCLRLIADDNTEIFRFDVPSLKFEEINDGNALNLSNETDFYTIFFANNLSDSTSLGTGEFSPTSILVGEAIDLIRSRSPQSSLNEEQKATNKQYIEFMIGVLNAYKQP